MSPLLKAAPAVPPAGNDNADPFDPAEDALELGIAAQSAVWHTRTYADLLRPRLKVLADEPGARSRALAAHLEECIGCRRSIRCEACPVVHAADRS